MILFVNIVFLIVYNLTSPVARLFDILDMFNVYILLNIKCPKILSLIKSPLMLGEDISITELDCSFKFYTKEYKKQFLYLLKKGLEASVIKYSSLFETTKRKKLIVKKKNALDIGSIEYKKKPRSAYNIFISYKMKEYTNSNIPNVKNERGTILQKISKEWGEIKPKEKERYVKIYKNVIAQFS